MNTLIKTAVLSAVMSLSALTLIGCGSSLDPETFSIEMNENDNGRWLSTTVLTIRSNSAEQIDVTNVTVNNGQCRYIGHNKRFNFPLHFQMGQVIRLRLEGCSFENVVQADIETTKGTVSYSFN